MREIERAILVGILTDFFSITLIILVKDDQGERQYISLGGKIMISHLVTLEEFLQP
jgi:hypothetical protein